MDEKLKMSLAIVFVLVYQIINGSFSLKYAGSVSKTDLLLRIDGELTESIPLLMKLRLIKCVLAFVFQPR